MIGHVMDNQETGQFECVVFLDGCTSFEMINILISSPDHLPIHSYYCRG
jgi:hypothetical protein